MSDADVALASIMTTLLFTGNLRRDLTYISKRKYCKKSLYRKRENVSFLKGIFRHKEFIYNIVGLLHV